MPLPLDTTGLAVTNLVTAEQHSISDLKYSDYNYIIPTSGPFFLDNLTVTITLLNGAVIPGIKGTHFDVAAPYIAATRSIGKPVYGVITLDPLYTLGVVTIQYQSLGSVWVADALSVANVLSQLNYNPKQVSWDQISNVQQVFPVVNNTTIYDPTTGVDGIITNINLVISAISGRPLPQITQGSWLGTMGISSTTGLVVPDNATGLNDDRFLHMPSGDLYLKTFGIWLKVGTLKGLDGVAGTTLGTAPTVAAANALIAANAASANAATLTTYAANISKAIITKLALNLVNTANAIGDVLGSYLYDTTKDYKDGIWTKQGQSKTWYNEVTLATGKWLGVCAGEADARSKVGASTGAYFMNSTDKAIYVLNAGAGVTGGITRGSAKDFPTVAFFTIHLGTVVIWDALDGSMWMVFNRSYNYYLRWVDVVVSSLCMSEGLLVWGVNAGSAPGLCTLDFNSEAFMCDRGTIGIERYNGVANRNTLNLYTSDGTGTGKLNNSIINAVAMATLPNATINLATGMPIPTILAGSANGWYQFNSDGSVYIFNFSVSTNVTSIGFTKDNRVYWTGSAGTWFTNNRGYFERPLLTYSTASGDSDTLTTIYANDHGVTLDTSIYDSYKAVSAGVLAVVNGGTGQKLMLLKTNPSTPANTLMARINDTVNTGWIYPQSVVHTLTDTVPGIIDGLNLVDPTKWRIPLGGPWSRGIINVLNGSVSFNSTSLAVSSMTITAGVVTITTVGPHGYKAGEVAIITGCVPAGYNILLNPVNVTSPTTLTYPSADYGAVTVLPTLEHYVIAELPIMGLVIGKTYKVNYDINGVAIAGNLVSEQPNNSAGVSLTNGAYAYTGVNGLFTATLTTMYLSLTTYQGNTPVVDNVYIGEYIGGAGALPKLEQVIGTLAKTPVNTNTQLVGYSGWSLSKYVVSKIPTASVSATGVLFSGWVEDVADFTTPAFYGLTSRGDSITNGFMSIGISYAVIGDMILMDAIGNIYTLSGGGTLNGSGGFKHLHIVTTSPTTVELYINNRLLNTTTILALGVPVAGVVKVDQWASSVVGFSSECTPSPGIWSAVQHIGNPNVLAYGDNPKAWQTLSPSICIRMV